MRALAGDLGVAPLQPHRDRVGRRAEDDVDPAGVRPVQHGLQPVQLEHARRPAPRWTTPTRRPGSPRTRPPPSGRGPPPDGARLVLVRSRRRRSGRRGRLRRRSSRHPRPPAGPAPPARQRGDGGRRGAARCRTGSGTGAASSRRWLYGCSGADVTEAASPDSTISPRYMTATRWLMCRTTDRSCVMNRYATPVRSWISMNRSSTRAWVGQVQGADRLVADDEPGPRREGPRDRDPLPLTAGELPRQPLAGVGGQVDLSSRSRTRWSPSCGRPPGTSSGSVRMSLTVIAGLSDVYGSWKTTWMSLLRARAAPCCRCCRSGALVADLAAGHRGEPQDRPAEGGLAGAGLADQADGLARPGSRRTRP